MWESTDGKMAKEKLIVPKKFKNEVIRQMHDQNTGGHFGINKTLDKIRHRFYWVGCRSDVENYCKTCDICLSKRGPNTRGRAPMKQYNVGAPFERIAIDVLGPLPQTERGNKYLLVVMDYFTKWPEVIPIPNQEAETVAEALLQSLVSRFGVPMELHSDQGRNFDSEVFGCLLKLLGTYKTRTTPLHPQSDGMVERFNRTILNYLAKYVEENQRDWDRHIHLCLLAYRSAVHETTQYSPSVMVTGREPRLPVDLVLGSSPDEERVSAPQYVKNLQERLWRINELAREHAKFASDRIKARYDLRTSETLFKEEDQVWFYNPRRTKGKSPKLQRSWEGPYEIVKCLNDVVFRIKKGQRGKLKVVHRDRLAPYVARD